jgi:hypothetical protein
MRKLLRRLKGYTGRVMGDIKRQLDGIPDAAPRKRIEAKNTLFGRLQRQKLTDKGNARVGALGTKGKVDRSDSNLKTQAVRCTETPM